MYNEKHILAVMAARDEACKGQLNQIGQTIGYGRAIQLLGQMWDDMMQASYPSVGRHQESMHRRSDIEKIEAGEPLARLVTYYRQLGPQGRHTKLIPMGEKLENVRTIERDIALYAHVPTLRVTAEVERNLRSELIAAGALRQYCHNDGSPSFVTAYDFDITNRFLASVTRGAA